MKIFCKSVRCVIIAMFAILVHNARASVSIDLLSSGSDQITVIPGESFTVDVLVQSDARDRVNLVGLEMVLNFSGIYYDRHTWQPPFTGQLPDAFPDLTTPQLSDLPQIVTADTMSETTATDFYLYNVSDDDKSFELGETYKIVSCDFTIPVNFQGSGTFSITVNTDSSTTSFFASGFDSVNISVVNPLQITVPAPPVGFLNWLSHNFTAEQVDDPSISGYFSDPDRDNIINILEFAYNTDPMTWDVDNIVLLGKTTIGNETYMTLNWRQNPQAGVVITPQFTESLLADWRHNGDTSGQSWTVEVPGSPTVEPDGTLIKTVRTVQSMDQNDFAFMRLNVQW